MSNITDHDLKERERQLEKQRDSLVESKREHENQLTKIKNLLHETMPRIKYQQCCQSQTRHIKAIALIESELRPIKDKMRELIIQQFEDRQVSVEVKQVETVKLKRVVQSLVDLREEYQRFSADHNIVSTRREMTAQFVLRLNDIIREAIRKDGGSE